ncbi:MAG: ParA family protein [Xenococcaceae cyanobacterium MO_167.B52]|nr:ParA family protein [Xenococcaceae cyanobacterium MO_167.B52]
MTVITAFCSSGTGKTTLLTHLAYYAATNNISTALIELDNRNSLKRCCGLPNSEFTTSNIFDSDFKGDYDFLPLWESYLKGKAEVCQTNRESLLATEKLLATKPLGILKLKKILKKYQLPHQLILLDAPGQEGVMSESAILASDYVILSIEATPKAMMDAVRFVQILFNYEEEYDVAIPEILGIVVSRYNHESSKARDIMEQLPDIAEEIGTILFSPIRHSNEFLNCYDLGIPLHLYRSGHNAIHDFDIDGNVFKDMSDKKLRSLDRKFYESLPAIAKTVIQIVKHG